MISFEKGQQIEYATHGISWQAPDDKHPNGYPICHDDEEQWAKGKVLSVYNVPKTLYHHVKHHHNVVKPVGSVQIEPEDGSPPFDIDARLVRLVIREK